MNPYPAKSNLNFEPAPVKSTVPDPVKLNPAIDVVEPPNPCCLFLKL